MSYSRRSFIKNTAIASSLFPFLGSYLPLKANNRNSETLDISVFSKHLQFLDYKKAGQIAGELGFNGIDLTVRPKGHVLPENVVSDLPRAIKDIENSGSKCKLITTSIESVYNPHDVDIIQTAGRSGISFYRTHWFKYEEGVPLKKSLKKYQKQIADLGKLNKKNNRIKVIVLKDFKWGKKDGKWKVINVPIGEGMVDFQKYFRLLKSYGLNPPVSLHLEYPLGGAEKGKYSINVDQKVVFDAMKKDLLAIRKLWKTA